MTAFQEHGIDEVPYAAIAAGTTSAQTHEGATDAAPNRGGQAASKCSQEAVTILDDDADKWLWVANFRAECIKDGPHRATPLISGAVHPWLAAVHRDRPRLWLGCERGSHACCPLPQNALSCFS